MLPNLIRTAAGVEMLACSAAGEALRTSEVCHVAQPLNYGDNAWT
jgi:hypothetical protein